VADPPTADPQVALEQMRVATDRLREQAWKVVQPTTDEETDSPAASA
jgi:hypothetical protein